MIKRELTQQCFTLPRQAHADVAPIGLRAAALHKPALLEPVNKPNHTVMPELQPLGQIPYRGLARMPFHRQ